MLSAGSWGGIYINVRNTLCPSRSNRIVAFVWCSPWSLVFAGVSVIYL